MSDAQVSINRIGTETLRVPLVGTAPLIVHKFSEKSKRQMLDAMQGRKTPKQPKDPEAEYEAAFYRHDDDGFGDLLDVLAEHPSPVHVDDRDRIRAAILEDGRKHSGVVNSNRVREALTNDSGELDVWHKAVGPQYHALKASGLIVEAEPIRSTDQRGRNAGRWVPTYELTAAGWSA